jgi:hypothetical protein
MEKLKEKLQKKYYYINVKDKYDVIKAHDLLAEIDVKVFKSDDVKLNFINKKNDIDDNWLIRDGDGWRIQSHFIGTDNSIEELEEDITIFLRKKNKLELSEEEIKKCEKEITELSKSMDSFLFYIYSKYYNFEDIKDIKNKISYFIKQISKRYFEDFEDFIKKEDFESNLQAFLREVKINNVL